MGSKEPDATFGILRDWFPARKLETAFYCIPAWSPSSRVMRMVMRWWKGRRGVLLLRSKLLCNDSGELKTSVLLAEEGGGVLVGGATGLQFYWQKIDTSKAFDEIMGTKVIIIFFCIYNCIWQVVGLLIYFQTCLWNSRAGIWGYSLEGSPRLTTDTELGGSDK